MTNNNQDSKIKLNLKNHIEPSNEHSLFFPKVLNKQATLISQNSLKRKSKSTISHKMDL